MAVALAIFGIAFAACSVCLTVRIINRRERWAKWTFTIIVLLIVLYPLSGGPAAWFHVHVLPPSTRKPMDDFYRPICELVALTRSQTINRALLWYTGLWADLEELARTAAVP